MALEQSRVTVRLVGAADNKTGEGWAWFLRDGRRSHNLYPTSKAAKIAGDRAIKSAFSTKGAGDE